MAVAVNGDNDTELRIKYCWGGGGKYDNAYSEKKEKEKVDVRNTSLSRMIENCVTK